MKTLIEFKTHDVKVTVEHNNARQLIGFKIDGEITKAFHDWIIPRIPPTPDYSQFKTLKNVQVSEIPEDLSFNRFWMAYDNKISAKKRTESIWEKLDDNERAKAIAHIKQYNRYLNDNPGVSKKHADTYLRQEIWNN